MTLYHLTPSAIQPLPETRFGTHNLKERADLQRLLKSNITVVAPDVLIIAEEFCEWEESKRRIDLLGVDRHANLVVIELKRDHDGGHMELQALRYAAMVSTMTFDRATSVYQRLLDASDQSGDARIRLLEFLGWDQPREEEFAREVRIILAAANFGKELTTTVLWLNDSCGLDVRCVRIKPYEHRSDVILDVQQIVPPPLAEDYQIQMRAKFRESRDAVRQAATWGGPTGYWFMNVGDAVAENRSWDDRRKYGFMSAGGGPQYIDAVRKLNPGDHILAYATGAGYVGVGRITSQAVPVGQFQLDNGTRLVELPLVTPFNPDHHEGEWCVGVRWLAAVERDHGVLRSRSYRGTLCQIHQQTIVNEVRKALGLPEDQPQQHEDAS